MTNLRKAQVVGKGGSTGVWGFVLYAGRTCGLGSLHVERSRGLVGGGVGDWAGWRHGEDPGDQKELVVWRGVRRTLESLQQSPPCITSSRGSRCID